MFGGESVDDFTIINPDSKANLAKLFEPGYSSYSPPKEPKMKSVAARPLLMVYVGKTVEAFKMENGKYKSYGKVGAALLKDEGQNFFQLYVYRNDERKIISINITPAFKFTVHENNYAMFSDRGGSAWYLRFDKASEMADFCKEVGLARWWSSEGKSKQLVQDIALGNGDKCIESGDRIVALYRPIPIGPDKQLCSELPKRNIVSSADEVGLIGAFIKSSRVVIMSHENLGNWKRAVPKGYSLMLEIQVEEILKQEVQQKLDPQASVNFTGRKQPDKTTENQAKQNLVARMARMGQLVPFPNFPSGDSDNRLDNEPPADHLILPSVLQEGAVAMPADDVEFKPQVEVKPTNPAVEVRETERCNVPLQYARPVIPIEEHLRTYATEFSINTQINVLFTEMRASNAELRMSMTRINDRIDALTHKVELSNDGTSNKLDAVHKHLEALTASHRQMHSHINERFGLLNCGQESEPSQKHKETAKSVTDNAEIERLKNENRELEEYLKAANAASDALQVKVSELKESIEMNEKQKELMENLRETQVKCCQTEMKGDHHCDDCKCKAAERAKTLQTTIKTLEDRNSSLETSNVQLGNKVAALNSELETISKEKYGLEEKFCRDKEDYCQRITDLENELVKLKVEFNNLVAKSTVGDVSNAIEPIPDITEMVKKLMNMTYRSLKSQLSKDTDIATFVQCSLAETLRMVTNNYLEQFADQREKCSVSRESPQATLHLNSEPSSTTVNTPSSYNLPQPTSNSSAALTSYGETSGSETKRFSPTNSPLPNPPERRLSNSEHNPNNLGPTLGQVQDMNSVPENTGPYEDSALIESTQSSLSMDNVQNENSVNSQDSSTFESGDLEVAANVKVPHSSEMKVSLDIASRKPPVPSRRNLDKESKPDVECHLNSNVSSLTSDISVAGSEDLNKPGTAEVKVSLEIASPSSSSSYPFVPLISSEPPPVMISPSPSPTNFASLGESVGDIKIPESSGDHETGVQKSNVEVWRQQPPPLFSDDSDDELRWWTK
ncbi:hypothetical protein AAG570_010579 [Ranatra chinensis]|uniref:Uncharacterized protein n=1 Tax=Ranatra chinensis TaxID=642074 RepID=A0ABD0YYX9_9HEMI